ncbi:MAG: branched-chain amino acid transport system II carrier protein [Streptococcus sp.]|nr:branched-chain amino acid transport system II carrier protein [Streptococcus sp.]
MKKKLLDTIIIGFALFAIFFGAGNLIFPPYLGVTAGENWGIATLAFLISDPLLSIIAVMVVAALGGSALNVGRRVHPLFASALAAICVLLIGPIFAVPRTGASTHEIFVQSYFPSAPQWITSLVFFGIVLWITYKENSVMDAIGKYLTPILLFILFLIFVGAVLQPNASFAATDRTGLFAQGFKEGYQTMDVLGAPLLAGVVMKDITRRGYLNKKDQFRMMFGVGIVAFILLALVYSTLAYSGASMSAVIDSTAQRAAMLTTIVKNLLGSWGQLAMGLAVCFACLTTAIGLTTTCGQYFEEVSKGKISYKKTILVTVAVEFIISLVGVDSLINLAVPVLTFIFPIMIALILFSAFDQYIPYDWTYLGAVVGAGIVGLVQGINTLSQLLGGKLLGDAVKLIGTFPLATYGLEWIVPTFVGALIFTILAAILKPKQLEFD